MVEGLLGNGTAERVLLFVSLNSDTWAQELADRLEISLGTVQNTLRRLERAKVIVAVSQGRTRLYSLNPRYAVATELATLLQRGFERLPEREQARYRGRRRPRPGGAQAATVPLCSAPPAAPDGKTPPAAAPDASTVPLRSAPPAAPDGSTVPLRSAPPAAPDGTTVPLRSAPPAAPDGPRPNAGARERRR